MNKSEAQNLTRNQPVGIRRTSGAYEVATFVRVHRNSIIVSRNGRRYAIALADVASADQF